MCSAIAIGTHYAFLDSAPSVRQASFVIWCQAKVKCWAGKTENLPGGLFERELSINSAFTRVMISLTAIYYKYASYYLILIFVWIYMKYGVLWLNPPDLSVCLFLWYAYVVFLIKGLTTNAQKSIWYAGGYAFSIY